MDIDKAISMHHKMVDALIKASKWIGEEPLFQYEVEECRDVSNLVNEVIAEAEGVK